MLASKRPWRRVLAAAVIASFAVVPASAPAASAQKLSPKAKKAIRAELRKTVKKNPGAVRRKSFLRRAALVNFKLPVTIRLRNPCTTENGQNPQPTVGGNPVGVALSTNCLTQGTALNQRTVPTANVNLGPSLGTRAVAIGGSLPAVVEFQDSYDGGALGNVNIKLLPSSTRFLSTSAVPLLWNDDIADTSKRNDANFLKATSSLTGLSESGIEQGCGDFATTTTTTGGIVPTGYNSLFHGLTPNFNPSFAAGAGIPGFPIYDPAVGTIGGVPVGYLPIFPGVDAIDRIQTGGVVGDNDWIGTNPAPFPTGSAPTNSGNPAAPLPFNYNAANTVLRTNALHLKVAPGGVSVNMSTGTPVTSGALPTAQGSQDVTLGYSGGQANLFGNIPGKNVGIDVTVNLAAEIAGIARIIDQDLFSVPLISGNAFPAGIFNCHQVWTGTVQNYIPGVRLTGSLRIAPAITKDGKVRIAKATVASDPNNPDRVALTACLSARSAYLKYNNDNPGLNNPGFSNASVVSKIPTAGGIAIAGGDPQLGSGLLPIRNLTLPVFYDEAFYDPATTPGYYTTFNANHPSPGFPAPYGSRAVCGTDPYPLVRDAGLTGTVGGLPTPTDPAYAGVAYKGDQATVAGDISVNPLDVDVLLGDQP
ncbi:MAG TPA: hypothetical protein PKD63_05395 [Solirubrobacteraceae bacterium]|nr:hypothetical protein [Solirubrobacteraceae bacterium]